MTLTQLKYLVAVAEWQSFSEAAARCFVTQPTLSMQIQALEQELGLQLFDRKKKPIAITEAGIEIVAMARRILRSVEQMSQVAQELRGDMGGKLRLAVLPTIGPYLLPVVLPQLRRCLPKLTIEIEELSTRHMIRRLLRDEIDVGILSTPLRRRYPLRIYPLFVERLFVYTSCDYQLAAADEVSLSDLPLRKLWLLTEAHCLRSQVVKLLGEQIGVEAVARDSLIFESSSIETLVRMVDAAGGWTIIPELAVSFLPIASMNQVKRLKGICPARQVSAVTNRHFARTRLLNEFVQLIEQVVSPLLDTLPDVPELVPVGAEVLE